MKRIGKYLITAAGLMTLCGAPALFADERYEHRERDDRRVVVVRHDRDHHYRRHDRDDYRWDRR